MNPFFIKPPSSRKSNVKDAKWIAKCLLKNFIKDSLVPDSVVQDIRNNNPRIMGLNDDMTTQKLKDTSQFNEVAIF